MKMKRVWQVAFLLFLIVGTVLIIRHQCNMPYQQNSGMVFGTVYNITYQCDRDLQPLIEEELQKVDRALSMFNEQSVISRINRGEYKSEDTEESRMFLDVCQLAMEISEDTEGAFDITVAPLVNLWGFGFKNDVQPSTNAIDSIRQFVGYQKLSVDAKAHAVKKQDPRIMLDCSAIAKGYGSDVVAALLRRNNVENYMVEIGGEIVTKGVNPKRLPWRIGVTKPVDDSLNIGNETQTVLNVTDKAMATSGNYRNFYYKGGRKYAHTINPKTGSPVQHSLLSATVIARNCAVADAYATAFMVLGMEGAKKVLERHDDLMAYLIFTDGKGDLDVWFSPSLKSKISE